MLFYKRYSISLPKSTSLARKNPPVFPFSSPIFGRDPSCRHNLPHDSSRSPNYSIRPRQHVGWNRQADLLGGFEVDDQLKLRWLLDREIGGLGTFRDFVHISGGAAVQVGHAHAVGHKPPSFHKFRHVVYRREPAL